MKIVDRSLKIAESLTGSAVNQKTLHFSFIFLRNKLLSVGQNYMLQPSPKALRFAIKFNCDDTRSYPYIHSEVDAIGKLWGKIHLTNRHKLVNIRLSRKNDLRQSKPCPSCTNVINGIGLQVIYYDKNLQLCGV